MEALQKSMAKVRANLDELDKNDSETIDILKGAGAEIGRLQIECCAPARMPLYAELLAGLSRTQRLVTSANGGMEH